jgi:hypothetical protein
LATTAIVAAVTSKALLEYFRALRGSRGVPVTKAVIRREELPAPVLLDRTSEEGAIEAFWSLMEEALDGLGPRERILVHTYLFVAGSSDDRGRVAFAHLQEHGVRSEHYYKNHHRAALDAYCDILAPRLSALSSTNQERASQPQQVQAWWQMVAIERELLLDDDDYRRQTWTTTFSIRCLVPTQPIVTFSQGWSGSGYRDGDIEVLSGPTDDERFEHRCLRIRPQDERQSSWDLYIFDLGKPLEPGAIEQLTFREVLVDEHDRFQTFMLWGTATHPALEAVTFRVRMPSAQSVSSFRAFREEPDLNAGTGFREAPPLVSVEPDSDGCYVHTFGEIDHRSRYAVDWMPDYKEREGLSTNEKRRIVKKQII